MLQNQEILTYTPLNNEELESLYCVICKKKLKSEAETIIYQNEICCALCGCIVSENKTFVSCISSKAKNISTSSTGSMREDTITEDYEIGLSTSIDTKFKDYTGKSFFTKENLSLKKTALRAKSNTSIERNIFKGYLESQRLAKKLAIPSYVIKEVTDTYNKFSKSNFLKNKNVNSCIICLLVILCNKYNIPLPINEALKETNVTRKKFNRDYFNIYYLFEKANPTAAVYKPYVEKLKSLILDSWPKKKEFNDKIDDIVKQGPLNYLEGRDTIVVTGTLFYALLKAMDYPLFAKFLKGLSLNRLTLKNRWAIICKQWPDIASFVLKESKTEKKLEN